MCYNHNNKEFKMENSLGKELNQEIYEELVAGTCLEVLSLEEIEDIAMNGEGMNMGYTPFYEFAGSYYRFSKNNMPVIIVDREQSVGGYNNSALTLEFIDDNTLTSNDKKFEELVYSSIEAKTNNNNL